MFAKLPGALVSVGIVDMHAKQKMPANNHDDFMIGSRLPVTVRLA